jgi:hypothetical protein
MKGNITCQVCTLDPRVTYLVALQLHAQQVLVILMARIFPSSDPCLPHYRSLLVQGDYHPSAPIHMCLSVPTGSKALLLSSSRKALIHSLREHNSEWLHTKSGVGNTCHSSSKVDTLLVPVSCVGVGAMINIIQLPPNSKSPRPIIVRVTRTQGS